MVLNEHEKRQQTTLQINDFLDDIRKMALQKLDAAVKSGAVPEYFYEADSYLLAKAVLDSVMTDRPYRPSSRDIRKDFRNINLCIF